MKSYAIEQGHSILAAIRVATKSVLVAVANMVSEMDYAGREEYRTPEKNSTSYQRAVVSDRVVKVATEGVHGGKDNVLILVERGYVRCVAGSKWAATRVIVKGYPRQSIGGKPAGVFDGGHEGQDERDAIRVSFPGCAEAASRAACFSWPQESTARGSPSASRSSRGGGGGDGAINFGFGRRDLRRKVFVASFYR